ncbi:MAG TPA: hypothetical protein DHU96_01250 [Actinobacteria bacterium]|nr:hypothetical protein [Actinomycetota bacterium]
MAVMASGICAELGTQVGMRPGGISGLHGHRVDWLRSQITVVDVMTRQRQRPRQWPKSRKVSPGGAGARAAVTHH